ncbi:hypothetical protein ACS0TY_016923 [Phlomoides rotata]
MTVANFVGSEILSIVNVASKGDNNDSRVSNNWNKGHYDYYYWILCLFSVDEPIAWDDEENVEVRQR